MDFHDDIEQIRLEGLQLTASVLDLLSDGAKAVKKVTKDKANKIRENLING